jgi:hypothetical protein
MVIGNGIGIPFTTKAAGGGGASYPIDSLTDTTNLVGSWSVEKAFASTYADTKAILGARMFTLGVDRDFTGDSVEAGDVAIWNTDTKVVITDMYDQSGNGNDWSTTILSRMPVYIDTTQVTMNNGSRAMEMINGYGLEKTALGLNGTDGVVLLKIKGGADISYRFLWKAGNDAPFITFVGNTSDCFQDVGNPDYEVNGSVMTPKTRGELHTQTSGNDVVLAITNIDWTADATWATATLQLAYQGDPKVSSITIWKAAPPAVDLATMISAYAL